MDYKVTLKAAMTRLDVLQTEYLAAQRKLSDTTQEVIRLSKVAVDLGPLAGESPIFTDVISEVLSSAPQSEALEVTITDKIRQLLQAQAAAAFQPIDVRTQLEGAKFDLSKHSNAMATIHMVLKRLAEQGQVLVKPLPDGKVAYQWNPTQPVKK
jgi:hypothetical protein